MDIWSLEEPELEFRAGKTHICPRHGIFEHDVFDADLEARRAELLVGVVGTEQGVESVQSFREWSARPIEAGGNDKLAPPFCGLNKTEGFRSELVTGDEIQQLIPASAITDIQKVKPWTERVRSAVDLYNEHIEFLCSYKNVDVVLCVLPNSLYDAVRTAREENPEALEAEYVPSERVDFRALLKASVLHLGVPIQIIRDINLQRRAPGGQDAATRAWNLCTALYYKANKTAPWRLRTAGRQATACFLGVSFHKSRDHKSLDSSTAQIFDEVGRSVILRGGPAQVSEHDRTPYLKGIDAEELLADALRTYRTALSNSPGRLVIHKTSRFLDEEVRGFEVAARAENVEMLDLVSVSDSSVKLLTEKDYPPRRGTVLKVRDDVAVLYTRGWVPFFGTYPGMYVPTPLEVRVQRSDRSLRRVCSELLSLSKMNWNNTQFDNKNPITLACSRRVGEVIKYLPAGENPKPSYAFYM